MKISAAIFDLDGTVVDSRKEWTKAFLEVLKSLGKEVTNEDPVAHGFPIQDNWRTLLQRYNIKTDKTLEELESQTYRSYVKFLPDVGVKDGAVEFIKNLRDSGVKTALATNSDWGVVEKVFDNLGLSDLFDATVTEEEAVNLKPFPDVLLLAADKLGTPIEECLAVGDTNSDIEAARAAGMKVAIIATSEPEDKKLEKADLVVKDYSEITPEAIDRL